LPLPSEAAAKVQGFFLPSKCFMKKNETFFKNLRSNTIKQLATLLSERKDCKDTPTKAILKII
jgi:hypothetical protein